MNIRKYTSLTAITSIILGLALSAPVFARTSVPSQSNENKTPRGAWIGRGEKRGIQRIWGTVSAVNGTSITVIGRARPNEKNTQGASMTYTANATNAKVRKNNSNSSVSSITVGDTVMIQGTLHGTNIVATLIQDGIFVQKNDRLRNQEKMFAINGDGKPVIGGTVNAVNGAIVSITNKGNITYTIDTTNASITKMGTRTPVSRIAVGDEVLVQGTINGSSIVASSVIDQGTATAQTTTGTKTLQKPKFGFFGSVNNFFSKLFGL